MAHYSTDYVLVQSKRGNGVNVTEVQLFEHERFMPLAGWSSRHLLPTERNRYSRQEDGMHSTNIFPQILTGFCCLLVSCHCTFSYPEHW